MNQSEDLKPQLNISKTSRDIEVENAINLLIVKGFLLAAPDVGVLSLSGKLARYYKEYMTTTGITPQQTAINKPEEKISLAVFKQKAEIPWQVVTRKGTPQEFKYNVGQISRPAEVYFNSKVVGKVDMNLLIELTKAFYKDETQARPTLSNFFLNGIWEDMLKNYKPKEIIATKNPGFTGERRL